MTEQHTNSSDDPFESDAGLEWRQLYAGSLHLGTWLATRRWEAAELERAVAAASVDIVWAGPTSAIAVEVPRAGRWPWPQARGNEPGLPIEWSGVLIRSAAGVVEMLRGLPSPLPEAAVIELAATVEELCPPAGHPKVRDQSSSSNNSA